MGAVVSSTSLRLDTPGTASGPGILRPAPQQLQCELWEREDPGEFPVRPRLGVPRRRPLCCDAAAVVVPPYTVKFTLRGVLPCCRTTVAVPANPPPGILPRDAVPVEVAPNVGAATRDGPIAAEGENGRSGVLHLSEA